jgi:hypothetical protein
MAEQTALHLEELNLKYDGEKSAKYGYRARVPGGWLSHLDSRQEWPRRRHVLP